MSTRHRNNAYQRIAHAPYQHERDRIQQALLDQAGPVHYHPDEPDDPYLKLARKLGNCCRVGQIAVHDDGDVLLHEQRCRSRACPRCALLRARELAAKLREAVARMNSPRLLTLTLAHRDEPLRDRLKALTTAFKALRRSKLWAAHFLGGAYTLEISWNHARHEWHPHLHAIVDGRYCPQSAISAAWLAATGDSRIVDVRKVHDARSAARYVASYTTKSSDTRKIPEDRLVEWLDAIHGMRLCQTFGSLHGQRLDDELPDKSDIDARAWTDVLAQEAQSGDPDARRLLADFLNLRSGLPRPRLRRATKDHETRLAETAIRVRAIADRQTKEAAHAFADASTARPPPNRPPDRTLWRRQDDPPAVAT